MWACLYPDPLDTEIEMQLDNKRTPWSSGMIAASGNIPCVQKTHCYKAVAGPGFKSRRSPSFLHFAQFLFAIFFSYCYARYI